MKKICYIVILLVQVSFGNIIYAKDNKNTADHLFLNISELSQHDLDKDIFKDDFFSWFCLYDVVSINDIPEQMKNFAYEINEAYLFLKLDDKIVRFDRVRKDEKNAIKYYLNNENNIDITIHKLKEDNFTEYRTSNDVEARFEATASGKSQNIVAFGRGCGI